MQALERLRHSIHGQLSLLPRDEYWNMRARDLKSLVAVKQGVFISNRSLDKLCSVLKHHNYNDLLT